MKRSVLLVVALVAALMPGPPAHAAPAIRFLNPSDYTGPPPFDASNKADADAAVHIVAWVKEVPASPLVEFEIESTTLKATIDGVRAGDDAWEANWVPPDSFTDGPYTLRAILYSGSPGNASEVASNEVTIVLNTDAVPPPPAPETVEMGFPENGGPLGFFVPKGKQPTTVIDFTTSELTAQVRALYTMSDPGNDPEWVACGFARVPESRAGRVRCTLKAGDSPARVTGVAVVANMTAPETEGNPALDETGDAHRVVPYTSVPTIIDIDPESQQVDNLTACFDRLTATMYDQRSRPIAAANIDVHATGPSDQLVFGSIANNRTSPFQAPDAGHPSSEDALRCSDGERVGRQGDHNVPLEDDIKHIESTTGTDTNGNFHFALKTDSTGGTTVFAFADVNDDDLPATSEASGGARIGWGVAPPPPVTELFVSPSASSGSTGSCIAVEATVRRGGSPLSGANVDVHVTGPDAGVAFCDVSGGSSRRVPDAGGHLGDAHEDGTKHAEGETGATGTFVFGVTSPSPGETAVSVWLDTTEDDVFSGELQRSSTLTWTPPGDRSITLDSNKSRVAKGRRVRLFGGIEGDPACAASQTVEVQAKPLRGGSFATVKTITTDAEGDYTTRIKMQAARRFRTVVPSAGQCEHAVSPTVTVRIRS